MNKKNEMDPRKFNRLCFRTGLWGIVLGATLTFTGVYAHSDYTHEAQKVNSVWCYLNNTLRSSETEREVDVRIAGAGLSLDERILFDECFKNAADSFEKEFGIVLKHSYAGMNHLQDACSESDIMRMADAACDAPYDFTLVATSREYLTQRDPTKKDYGKLFVYDGRPLAAVDERFKENGKTFIDHFTDKTRRLVFINGVKYADANKLTNTIKHEIAHLFYAKHVDGKKKVMCKYVLPHQDTWSDETRAIIKRYKWRLW